MTDTLKKTDVEIAGLSGQVKQISQTTYKASLKKGIIVQGKIQVEYSSSNTNTIISYNEKGAKTQEQLFGLDGYYINTYNERGLQTKSVLYYKDGKLNRTTILSYNKYDKLLEYCMRDADGILQYRTENKYDDQGKELESYSYHGKDEIVYSKKITTYNPQGLHLSTIEYKQDGSINYKYLHTYDDQGKEIEDIWEYADKKMQDYCRKGTKKYNEQGDCIENNYYNYDGSLKFSSTYAHKYNELGQCIETTNYNDGRLGGTTFHKYDDQGKKIMPVHIPNSQVKNPHETEEFEYDTQGNWIKKTVIYNKIPVNIYRREIIYYTINEALVKGNLALDSDSIINDPLKGPATNDLIHPITADPANITNIKTITMEDSDENNEQESNLTAQQTQWLSETLVNGIFPIVRYYAAVNKELPSEYVRTSLDVEVFALLHELQETMEAKIIHSYSSEYADNGKKMIRYTLVFPNKGYILEAIQIQSLDAEQYEMSDFIEDKSNCNDDGCVHVSQLNILSPNEASGKRDKYGFEEDLQNCIDKCTLKKIKIPEKPMINMIEVTTNGYVMREHAVDDDFEIRDLDINYGFGFAKFHDELMQRFNTSSKGLVLFHGLPGTGKTYYIRHLLKKMASGNKVVIYMPPNMVDHLVEPAFMTFISNAVSQWNEDEQFCVLLIEDAEPLLAKRQEGIRIQGVSNLLNMTDGLLNDMLNMQIICTFNVDLKKLDSALLRPGRLLARKEFKALSELDSNILAQRLGIKHHFKKGATLSEIYSMLADKGTLIHDVEPDRDASKAIDDL